MRDDYLDVVVQVEIRTIVGGSKLWTSEDTHRRMFTMYRRRSRGFHTVLSRLKFPAARRGDFEMLGFPSPLL